MSTKTGLLAAVFAAAVAAPSLRAQLEASTLEALTRSAPLVLEIETGRSSVERGRRILPFKLLAVHRGAFTGPFVLSEPAPAGRRTCGSALAGLGGGLRALVFALPAPGGPRPIGGARGIVLADSPAGRAAKELLAARDPNARLRLLLAQSTAQDARVRLDAVLALAVWPGLESAAPALRAAFVARARHGLAAGGPAAFAFLDGLARLAPAEAARAAWKLLAAGRAPHLAERAAFVLAEALPEATVLATAPRGPARARLAPALRGARGARLRAALGLPAARTEPHYRAIRPRAALEPTRTAERSKR